MLSAGRQSVILNFKRMIYQGGCLSGIIKDPHIEEFKVKNEPVLGYLPGSKERKELESALKEIANNTEDVPIIIGGQEYRTKDVRYQVMPHDHKKKIAQFYYATPQWAVLMKTTYDV